MTARANSAGVRKSRLRSPGGLAERNVMRGIEHGPNFVTHAKILLREVRAGQTAPETAGLISKIKTGRTSIPSAATRVPRVPLERANPRVGRSRRERLRTSAPSGSAHIDPSPLPAGSAAKNMKANGNRGKNVTALRRNRVRTAFAENVDLSQKKNGPAGWAGGLALTVEVRIPRPVMTMWCGRHLIGCSHAPASAHARWLRSGSAMDESA